jgi:hypothetical protein
MPWNSLPDEVFACVLRGRFLVGRCINRATRDALMRALADGNYPVRLTVTGEPFTPFADMLRFAKSLEGACFLVPTRAMTRQWRNQGVRVIWDDEPILVNRARNKPAKTCCPIALGHMLARWNDPTKPLPSGTNVLNLSKISWRLRLEPATDPSAVPHVVQAFDEFFRRISNHPTFVSEEYMFRAMNLWSSLPDCPDRPVRRYVAVPSLLTGPGRLLALSRVAAEQPQAGLRVFDHVFERLGMDAITSDADAAAILSNLRLLMPSTDRMGYRRGKYLMFPWVSECERYFLEVMGACAVSDPTLRTLLVDGGWRTLWADVDGELRPEGKWFLATLDDMEALSEEDKLEERIRQAEECIHPVRTNK